MNTASSSSLLKCYARRHALGRLYNLMYLAYSFTLGKYYPFYTPFCTELKTPNHKFPNPLRNIQFFIRLQGLISLIMSIYEESSMISNYINLQTIQTSQKTI